MNNAYTKLTPLLVPSKTHENHTLLSYSIKGTTEHAQGIISRATVAFFLWIFQRHGYTAILYLVPW